MILFFVLALAAAVLLLERNMVQHSLDGVEGDHWPEERLVDPDEPFHYVLSVKNTGRRYVPFVKLVERIGPEFQLLQPDKRIQEDVGGWKIASFTTWLRPAQEVRFQIPVSIAQRGQYRPRNLEMAGGDFLGLREHVLRLDLFRAVVVAPREAPAGHVAEVLGGFLGDVSVRRFLYEDPVLTAGFRAYTGREPMKQIAWAQSARGQGLMVKQYDHTAEPSVSVLLNVDSAAREREELLERCFSLTRTICRVLEERQISYSFATNADLAGALADRDGLRDGLGRRHFSAILECLGRATYLTAYSGTRLLERSMEAGVCCGRILITPADDFSASDLGRLRDWSDGNLLVVRAEAEIW